RRDNSGLNKRGRIWHIQKRIGGNSRLYESTGTSHRAEAERYLAHRLNQIRAVSVYGERPLFTFREAGAKFIDENAHLRSLRRYALSLDTVDPYIGDVQEGAACARYTRGDDQPRYRRCSTRAESRGAKVAAHERHDVPGLGAIA